MKLNKEIEKDIIQENKREQLIDAEFKMIEATGKLSGNIKDILYLEDINDRRERIQLVENNLQDVLVSIFAISDALKLDFDKILKGKIEN